jgi:toxin ParE1/3/4
MPLIVLRPRARQDLLEIWEYIAADSEARADAFVDGIDRKFQLLAAQTGIGRARNETAQGLRSIPVGRYIIFYLPLTSGIEVVRVLHGSRDLNAAFQSEE